MEYRPLNITVISAEGLKDVNMFSKMDLYAVVSIEGYSQSKKKTFVDKDCGTNPKWNHRMEIIVDEPYLTKPGLSLLFQIKAESTIGSDKEVGSVTIPLDDLYKNNPSGDKVVEYQVRTSSGKPKGSLKISYSFGEKFTQQTEAKKHTEEPMMAYPAAPGAGPSYPPQPYPGMGYPPQYPPAAGYPGYPPQGGYGYQAPPQGAYGYQPPPQGYGYPAGYAAYPPGQNPKKNKMGMGGMGGMGMGLGAGLLGGLLVGEMVSDIGDAGAYADGYSDAMGDMGDF
ncbi:protein SRC2 homolog [Primulina huaijiensis]|uniref:protein SRC2 homolog n=1 Tax=Primulina huaijiensis TaxID=1492673 RepID=UPI003CC73DE1